MCFLSLCDVQRLLTFSRKDNYGCFLMLYHSSLGSSASVSPNKLNSQNLKSEVLPRLPSPLNISLPLPFSILFFNSSPLTPSVLGDTWTNRVWTILCHLIWFKMHFWSLMQCCQKDTHLSLRPWVYGIQRSRKARATIFKGSLLG